MKGVICKNNIIYYYYLFHTFLRIGVLFGVPPQAEPPPMMIFLESRPKRGTPPPQIPMMILFCGAQRGYRGEAQSYFRTLRLHRLREHRGGRGVALVPVPPDKTVEGLAGAGEQHPVHPFVLLGTPGRACFGGPGPAAAISTSSASFFRSLPLSLLKG